MRVAVDANNNRIYAKEEARETECFCQGCGEKVIPRIGKIKIPHFAHAPQSECPYGKDKDSKSEWHIRMQDYFLIDAQEVRFVDEANGQVHIADVFLKESNTVIEFQHSPISPDEFCSRTAFHLNSGRRIAWVFDESSERSKMGRFREDELAAFNWPYIRLKWLRSPRKCLNFGPDLNAFNDRYSVCVFIGDNEDTIHRIVRECHGFESVDFSFHHINMGQGMNIEEFFTPDTVWQTIEPYKEVFDQYKEYKKLKRMDMYSSNIYRPRRLNNRRNICL